MREAALSKSTFSTLANVTAISRIGGEGVEAICFEVAATQRTRIEEPESFRQIASLVRRQLLCPNMPEHGSLAIWKERRTSFGKAM